MAKQSNSDPLKEVRDQVRRYISENYESVEAFCWENDLNKATVSNFLRNKKDFQISTIVKIARAVHMNLVIKFES